MDSPASELVNVPPGSKGWDHQCLGLCSQGCLPHIQPVWGPRRHYTGHSHCPCGKVVQSKGSEVSWSCLQPGGCTYWLCDLIKLSRLTEPQFPHLQEEDGAPSVALSKLVQGQKGRFLCVGPWTMGTLSRWCLSLFTSSKNAWTTQTRLQPPQSLECGGCTESG